MARRKELDEAKVYVWIDFFALNQHQLMQAEADPSMVRQVIVGCEKGVVAIVDPELRLLRRTWCMFEIVACAREHGMAKVKICFDAATLSAKFLKQFEILAKNMDLSGATDSTRPGDKVAILSEVRGLSILIEISSQMPVSFCN